MNYLPSHTTHEDSSTNLADLYGSATPLYNPAILSTMFATTVLAIKGLKKLDDLRPVRKVYKKERNPVIQ